MGVNFLKPIDNHYILWYNHYVELNMVYFDYFCAIIRSIYGSVPGIVNGRTFYFQVKEGC